MTIINDILDLSKLEAGRLRLTPRPFNLRQTVEEVSTMMQARATEKDLELIVRYAPTLPEGVIGDETRIRQVLSNIIGNAVKFTERGHVAIEVSGERNGGTVDLTLVVQDTGVGIAEEDVARVFGRFEQADSSHTRRNDGAGLGLAICKDLVSLMDGDIGAASSLGVGSTFWFSLTLPVDDNVRAMPIIDATVFENVRVLAVDDNAVNRRVIAELMTNWKISAECVENGAAAFAALDAMAARGARASLILMDHQMPDETGLMLTRRLQADPRYRTIPVIMLSSVDRSNAGESQKARFSAWIAKPIRSSHLMDVMARVLSDAAARTLAQVSRRLTSLEADALAAAETSGALSPESPAQPDGRIQILLAEDNVVNQMVFTKMIDAARYDVAIANDGAEALKLFAQLRPALILMDVSMPTMDGYEATRRIRALEAANGWPATPIVAATAHALDEDRRSSEAAGMSDFIAKPIRKPALEQMLAKWTETRSAAKAASG
jgi:CheY-like chemotaxis protein